MDNASKEKIIKNLLLEVEKRYAIQASHGLILKMERIFDKLPEGVLAEWTDSLKDLPAEHPEWQSFVEGLTVHETYFCRDPEILNGIRDYILPQLIKNNEATKQLRVWSAACSTGEEAYNVAILVAQALYTHVTGEKNKVVPESFMSSSGWTVDILGSDLSKQVVRIAETGTYNDIVMGSFRTHYDAILPYFDLFKVENIPDGTTIHHYKIKEYIQKMTCFSQFNLLNENSPIQDVDLIICRNTLIYFSNENREKIQKMFDRVLIDHGVMVLGSVDSCMMRTYQRHSKDGCIWYKKVNKKFSIQSLLGDGML
jgi:chemotaxis protein methyltransferase CheR